MTTPTIPAPEGPCYYCGGAHSSLQCPKTMAEIVAEPPAQSLPQGTTDTSEFDRLKAQKDAILKRESQAHEDSLAELRRELIASKEEAQQDQRENATQGVRLEQLERERNSATEYGREIYVRLEDIQRENEGLREERERLLDVMSEVVTERDNFRADLATKDAQIAALTFEREQFIQYCQSLKLATGEAGPIQVAKAHINRLLEKATILDEIAIVMETHGWAHMTNNLGIDAILSDAESDQKEAKETRLEANRLRAELSALREDMAREHTERVRLMQVGDLQEKDITALKTECEGLKKERDAWKFNEDIARANGRYLAERLRIALAEAEEAKHLADAQSNLLSNINDTLRSRGFQGNFKTDERVIQMAQSRDAAVETCRKALESIAPTEDGISLDITDEAKLRFAQHAASKALADFPVAEDKK